MSVFFFYLKTDSLLRKLELFRMLTGHSIRSFELNYVYVLNQTKNLYNHLLVK